MNIEIGQVWVSPTKYMPNIRIVEVLENIVCGESINVFNGAEYNELIWLKKDILFEKYELRDGSVAL